MLIYMPIFLYISTVSYKFVKQNITNNKMTKWLVWAMVTETIKVIMYREDGLGNFGNFEAKYLCNNYVCFLQNHVNLVPVVSLRLREPSKELIKL